jgi:hypothetical protein
VVAQRGRGALVGGGAAARFCPPRPPRTRESAGQGEGGGDSPGRQVNVEARRSGGATVLRVGGGAPATGAASSARRGNG